MNPDKSLSSESKMVSHIWEQQNKMKCNKMRWLNHIKCYLKSIHKGNNAHQPNNKFTARNEMFVSSNEKNEQVEMIKLREALTW